MSVQITPAIIGSFRDLFPAFQSQTRWPSQIVENALIEADEETGSSRWGAFADEPRNFKQRGMFFYAAHWLASQYLDQTAENPENIEATARLNVSQKSIGDESVAFRITEIQSTGDDWLSTSFYGVQFLRLRRRTSIGCVAL